jgi:cytochrome P450
VSPLPELDLRDPAFWADPHAPLAAALAEAPVARLGGGSLMVLGHPEVLQVLRDPALGTVNLLARAGIVDGPLAAWWSRVMFSTDPPEHTRLRRLVSHAFTPRRVAALEPVIEAIVADVLDDLERAAVDRPDRTTAPVDLVAGFAHLVPLRTMAHILAIEPEHQATFAEWTSALGLVFSAVMPAPLRAQLEQTVVALERYVNELVEERRRVPGDDLLSALVAAEEDGDRLSRDELVALVGNLLFAGHDTTRSLLSIAPVVLDAHPDQRARAVDDPERWPAVVDEVLRYEPPVLGTARRVLHDTTLAGIALPAGTELATNLLAANRDPRAFADPHRFDIDRFSGERTSPPIVSFGAGVHYCLGAALARLEATVALRALYRRFPDLQVVEAPQWVPFASIRRYERVLVRW